MKVGDPKKAAVLAVVALIVICAGVFELIPRGTKPLPQVQPSAPSNGGQAPSPANPNPNPAVNPGPNPGTQAPAPSDQGPAVSATLTVDPFSNPKLATGKKDKNGNPMKTSQPLQPLGDDGKPVKPSKHAGLVPMRPNTMQGDLAPAAIPGVTPDKSAGNSQDLIEKQPDTITLQGVVKVEHSVAFVAFNGGAAIRCKKGDIIADELVKVVAVGDSGITVRTSKRTLTLKVGETKKL